MSVASYRGSVGSRCPAFQFTIEDPVANPKPESIEADSADKPAPRSEALEAELAMLEAILPAEAERSVQPTRTDSPRDCGDNQ